jgi:hypothetical protein
MTRDEQIARDCERSLRGATAPPGGWVVFHVCFEPYDPDMPTDVFQEQLDAWFEYLAERGISVTRCPSGCVTVERQACMVIARVNGQPFKTAFQKKEEAWVAGAPMDVHRASDYEPLIHPLRSNIVLHDCYDCASDEERIYLRNAEQEKAEAEAARQARAGRVLR